MASKTFTAPGQLPTRRNYCGPPSRHFPPPHGPPPGHHYGAPPYPPPTPHDSEPPSHFYSCPPPPHDFGCPPPPPPQHNPGYPPPSGHFQRQEAMWMTPEIRAELQIRNKLKMTDQQAYKAQCDKVQHMIDQSKASVGAGGYSVSPGQSSDPQLGNDPATLEAIATYYQNPSKYHSQVHTCGPCNRTYFSKRKLDEHLKEHVDCPFPECKMNAHTKVIDQHINNQHMLVNFANLQIDDKAWVTERKKRFPTAERAELRRAQQLEKVKRGEKLGRSTKPFPNKQGMSGKLQSTSGKFDRTNMGDRDRKRKDVSNTSDNKERKYSDRNKPQDNNETKYSDRNRPHDNEAGTGDNKVTKDSESKPEERGRGGKFLKNRRKHLDRPPRAHLEVDMFDSDDDKDKPPPFQGTRHFYESTGEVNYFGNINADILDSEDEVSAQDDKNNLGISDDDEWQFERKDVTISSGALVLGGALGSLMGAYSDSEDEEPEQITVKDSNVKPATNASQQSNNLPTKPSQASNAGCPGVNKTNSKAASNENSSQSARPKQRRRPRAHKNNNNKKSVKPAPVRRFPRRRKTLLQKLLLPDIIHERNVILQCARFIVKNNFFDDFVGEEEEGGVREENGGREGGVREGDGGKEGEKEVREGDGGKEREEGVMEGHECKEGKKGVREGDGGKEGEKGGKEGDGGKEGEEGKEEGVRKGDRGKEGGVREGDEGKEEEKGVREGDGGKEGEEGVSKGYGGKEGIKKGEGVKEAGMEEGGIAEEGGEKESQEKAAVTPKETENEVLARNGTDSGNKRKRDEPVEMEQKENCAGYQLPRNKERRVSDESKTDQTETGKGEVENSQSRGKDEEKRIGTENERRKEEGGNMEDRRNSTVTKNETRKGSDDMEVERTNDDIKELDQKMDEGGNGVKDKCMATKDEDERTTSDKELPSLENSVSKTNIASSDDKHGSDEECNITKESMAPNPSGDSKTVVASKNEGNTDSKTVVDSKHKESSDSNTVVDYNKENCDSNTVVDSNKESCDSNTVVDYNKENCNSKTVVDSKNEENGYSNTVVDSNNKESSDSKTVVDYKNAENGDSKTVVDSKNKESSDSNIVVDINKENCDSNAVVDSKNNKKHVRLQVCVETSDSETVISSSDNSTECKPSLNTAMGENGLDNDSKTDVDFKALEKSSSDRVVDRSAIQRDSTESDNPSLHSAIAENGHSSTSTKRNATDLDDHCDDSTENKANKIKKQRLPSSTENDDNTTVQ